MQLVQTLQFMKVGKITIFVYPKLRYEVSPERRKVIVSVGKNRKLLFLKQTV